MGSSTVAVFRWCRLIVKRKLVLNNVQWNLRISNTDNAGILTMTVHPVPNYSHIISLKANMKTGNRTVVSADLIF